MIEHDQVNHLQFYEYIDYLYNQDKKFGYYGYYIQNRLIAIQYFSPLNSGFTMINHQYTPLLKEELLKSSSTYIYGPADVLSKFDLHPDRRSYLYQFGYLNNRKCIKKDTRIPVSQASFKDITGITEFYHDKEIMIEIPERLPNLIKNGSIFIVKVEGRIQSIALAHSETADYALIGGVYTSNEARGKGYAFACYQALAGHLFDHHKTPYLFYDSTLPHLDKFYRDLGFAFTEHYLLLY
ncbi:GNAT family N-acetyltransferase [Rossellomorea sp. NPDC077527]|uniref:GNAT family N-acetyltransferase n=1 Tax=Rossellomorea sp. NPDC077527 TaxID=3364510 RepID=UPI0037C83786